MRACFALAALLFGCTGSSSSGDPPDASDARAAQIGDGGAPEAASISCPNDLSCTFGGDCVAKGGGVAGCWGCFGGCCAPTPERTDPTKACMDGGTVCTPSTCDGTGSCSGPHIARDGTPCGQLCGGVFLYARAACFNGVCVGDPSTQTACNDRCYGDFTPCDRCDGLECIASCTALSGHPDRCFR